MVAEKSEPIQGQAPVEAVEQRDGGVTLMDMLRIIRKHLISAIITFVVVFAAVCAYTLLVPPKYSATAQAFATYNQTVANSEDISSVNNASSYISNQIKSYPTLTTTEAVLQPVIDDLGLNVTVAQLGQQLTVTNPTNTAFVNITVEDDSPQQSATIANEVAKSLQSVVQNSLYDSSQKSPVKLTIVQQATEPTSPSSPKVALNMAIGLVVGAILAVFVALIRDLLSTKVQESHDLQEIIDAPIMGRIPDDESLKQPVPVIVSAPSSSIAEEYRRVRTNLSFTSPVEGSNARLIVISSVSPNEGKTTTSVNIAATLAENGASVLLIDADLRHPSVADKLSLEGNAGLAHVLSGQASVKDVVQRYWKPNLHIMPAGPKPPNASALLNSKTMKELIRQALTQYDYVIIDTSPMIVANDAAVFGAMGGGIVLVSGRDVTDKRELRDIASQLDNLGVTVTGFVFNFAKETKKTSSYGNYYYDDDDSTQHRKGKRRSSSKKK
ncbi:Etk-like tyrosine kinase [Bifidobacterium biavatii DSM 23969]|uniref:non-specific protein-tyrosine kinase n=2 Tax=Bifidobacterium biavatii TaxID=762212 RepID=A0A086ZSZ1_9BIFI|nr:polysaccharide biosynthesis tyrosine autokinase [Bifidobacterium biavatii]KFI49641.1 Etk-like tyrosine kinase [Bifidobacterium biavatii DSM 23969]